MKLTPEKLYEFLKIIELNSIVFITQVVGSRVLNEGDRVLLASYGIDINDIEEDYPELLQSYHWGRLSQILLDQSKTIKESDFKEYLKRGQYIPLTNSEKHSLEYLENKSYSHIKGLTDRMKQSVSNTLIQNDLLYRAKYEKAIKDAVKKAVIEKESAQQIVSEIGHSMDNWEKDLGRIAETELNNAFQSGRAERIKEENGDNALVYKDVYKGACFPVEDTEYFTNEGFKKLNDIKGNEKVLSFNKDNGDMEWVNIVSVIRYDYTGDMHLYKNENLDLFSTPNHKHLIGKRVRWVKEDTYENVLLHSFDMRNLVLRDVMYLSGKNWKGYNEKYITVCGKTIETEYFSKFMGWWLSDGHISFRRKRSDGSSNMTQIAITQTTVYNFKEIEEIFRKMFPDRNILHIQDKFIVNLDMSYDDLSKWFLNLGKAISKHIPIEVLQLDQFYLNMFLNCFLRSDGHIGKIQTGKRGKPVGGKLDLYTSSKRMSEGLVEVVIKCGYRPYVAVRDEIGKKSYKKDGSVITVKNLRYIVTANKTKYVKNINTYFSVVKEWTGEVGCLELDKNFTLYIRRAGKCVWTGNCRHCIKLYLTNGIGSQPIVFKLADLQANGDNIGLKVADWKATVGSIHPWCRCTLQYLPKGFVWNEEKERFTVQKYSDNKYGERGTIKIMIGDEVRYV